MIGRLRRCWQILCGRPDSVVTFADYVKTLPLKEDAQYLLVIEKGAVSLEVLSRLKLPGGAVILLVSSMSGCDSVRLFELKPQKPVAEVDPSVQRAIMAKYATVPLPMRGAKP